MTSPTIRVTVHFEHDQPSPELLCDHCGRPSFHTAQILNSDGVSLGTAVACTHCHGRHRRQALVSRDGAGRHRRHAKRPTEGGELRSVSGP